MLVGMPAMCEVVLMMDTLTVTSELGMLSGGGGEAG